MQESGIVPFSVSPPPGRRVLVLAPHPDDESLGCGGSIRVLLGSGADVCVAFLTSGEQAEPSAAATGSHVNDYSLKREREALRALGVLGVGDFEFFRFPDRGLSDYFKEAGLRVSALIEKFQPDRIYSPSMVDLHPDHRASAALALEAGAKHGAGVVFYELTTPLRPNLFVDITAEARSKKKAIKKYSSQLAIMDYLGLIVALNKYRTFTLPAEVKLAEALWVLGDKQPPTAAWMSYGADIEAYQRACSV